MEAQGKNISQLMVVSGLKKKDPKKKTALPLVDIEPSSPSRSSSEYEKYIKDLMRKAILPLRFDYIPEVEEFEEILKINL